MTPATHHGLLSAILSHRLPPILLNSTSKPTTRMGGKGYRSLSELQLKYSSGSESILSNLHDSLQRAAPILSQRDPHVVDRFARYEADARSYAQLPIHSETSLATFLHSFLLLPINLHLLAINDGHMPTLFWEASSSRETSAAPDFCLRLMEDRNYPDKPVIIGTIELKTATALSSTELMTLSKDFDDGKYIIDEDGRAVPADQAGLGPRRRVPKICHLLDQVSCTPSPGAELMAGTLPPRTVGLQAGFAHEL